MISQASVVAELEGALEPRDAAKVLGIKVATLRLWRCKRKGPAYIKLGNRVLYPRARVEKYLEGRVSLVLPDEKVA